MVKSKKSPEVQARITQKKKEYYQKRYRQYKRERQPRDDYGQKSSLLVMYCRVLKKPADHIINTPVGKRRTLHKFNYHNLPGTDRIPEHDCKTDIGMARHAADRLGTGVFIIKAGNQHKDETRVKWRALIQFEAIEHRDGSITVRVLHSWKQRLRHYWFRK